MHWLLFLLASFIFVFLAGCYLYVFPIGFPQLAMVFSCLFFSVILADLAQLRQKLIKISREIEQEERILG